MDFKKFIIENHPDPDSVFGIDKYDFEQIVVLVENFAKKEVEAIDYTRCSTQLKDKEEEIIGNVTSVGFTTPSSHGFLKIELPYSYYKIEKISKGDKIRLLIA